MPDAVRVGNFNRRYDILHREQILRQNHPKKKFSQYIHTHVENTKYSISLTLVIFSVDVSSKRNSYNTTFPKEGEDFAYTVLL